MRIDLMSFLLKRSHSLRVTVPRHSFYSPVPFNPSRPISRPLTQPATMTTSQPPNGTADSKPKANAKRQLNILMLHGYTQSGTLFRSKTRALEKLLAKALAPLNLTLACHYPTAPIKLDAREIPGYTAPEDPSATDLDTDSWAWFRKRDDPSVPGGITYLGLDTGMAAVASAIRSVPGGIDAVIGFSQGGALAALVASALETPHRASPAPWASDLRAANAGRGLAFAAVYSGFLATDEAVSWCFDPAIRTPTVHFVGSLDTVVEEARSQALVARCEDPVVIVHPGGHYVPVSKEWAMALAGFVQKRIKQQEEEAAKNSGE